MNKIQKLAISAGSSVVGLATFVVPVAAVSVEPIVAGQGFANDFGTLINNLLSFVMVIAALLVFMYLIWGGIEWITSGGDKGKTESARNKITSAIIGLIVVAASYAILTLALQFLGFDDLDAVFRNAKTQTP